MKQPPERGLTVAPGFALGNAASELSTCEAGLRLREADESARLGYGVEELILADPSAGPV